MTDNVVYVGSPRRVTLTARQIIEKRLGRPLGPLKDMPNDLKKAMYLLGLQIVKEQHSHKTTDRQTPTYYVPNALLV